MDKKFMSFLNCMLLLILIIIIKIICDMFIYNRCNNINFTIPLCRQYINY